MKTKLAAALPFAATFYLAGALLLACYPPWIVGTADSPRYFYGFAPLWNRAFGKMTNGVPDWSSLTMELLAWAFVTGLLLAFYACWLRIYSSPAEPQHTAGHIECSACEAARLLCYAGPGLETSRIPYDPISFSR